MATDHMFPTDTEANTMLTDASATSADTMITLDTPLSNIDWDAASDIGEDLIDTDLVGDEWGWAWDRVIRAGGTVRDLRDELIAASLED